VDFTDEREIPYRPGIHHTRGRTKRVRRMTASLGRRKHSGLVEPMSSLEQR
jgi:hypothetical protein